MYGAQKVNSQYGKADDVQGEMFSGMISAECLSQGHASFQATIHRCVLLSMGVLDETRAFTRNSTNALVHSISPYGKSTNHYAIMMRYGLPKLLKDWSGRGL
eukprot:526136-Amphidinium_carterae.3